MTTEARRERKVVTVLFADLVGFTSASEQMDPEDVEAILRPYHERLRYDLERWGGTVEKFIGDAVVAFFGAPVAGEDDPERAVRATLAIRDWIVEVGRGRGDAHARVGGVAAARNRRRRCVANAPDAVGSRPSDTLGAAVRDESPERTVIHVHVGVAARELFVKAGVRTGRASPVWDRRRV
jgi:class 3 adenylate cyclase